MFASQLEYLNVKWIPERRRSSHNTHTHKHSLVGRIRIRVYFRRFATRSDGDSNGEWAATVVKLAVLYANRKTRAFFAVSLKMQNKRKSFAVRAKAFFGLFSLDLSSLSLSLSVWLPYRLAMPDGGRCGALSRVFNECFWSTDCLSLIQMKIRVQEVLTTKLWEDTSTQGTKA